MSTKKWILMLVVIMASVGVLAACSSSKENSTSPSASPADTATSQESAKPDTGNAASFPLKDPITLTGFVQKSPQVTKNDFNDMQVFEQLEQATNVKVNWTMVTGDVLSEKKNLTFASNNLPDFFLGSNVLTNQDIIKYGSQGQLIPLEGLIDQYAPNAKQLFETRPDIKKAITAPDGHIYAMPMVFEEMNNTAPDALFINKEWLDQLGLPVPTTTEQFEATLKAFKGKDLNNNGKNDEIPFSFIYGQYIQGLYSMAGSFGFADNSKHLAIDNGKIIYVPVQDGYRDFANYVNGLQQAGLIDSEAFTHSENIYTSKIQSADPIIGAYYLWDQSYLFGKVDTGYVPVPFLEGPDGHKQWQKELARFSNGGFAITSANTHPEVTLQWFDQIYNEETSIEHFWGPVEKNVKKNDDGSYAFLPVPEGASPGTFRCEDSPCNAATVMLPKETLDKVNFADDIQWKEKRDLLNLYAPLQPKEIYPNVLMTEADTERLNILSSDINTYAKDTLAKWVINGGVDAEWDSYVSQLKKMGLDEMIALYQKYYDSSKS